MVSDSNHFNVDSNRFSEIQGDGYYEIHLKDAYKGSVTPINLIAQKPGSCFVATLIVKYEYTSSKLVNIRLLYRIIDKRRKNKHFFASNGQLDGGDYSNILVRKLQITLCINIWVGIMVIII